ncbi:MAG: manganese catalase family protein [Bacillota bacterium]
MWIYEKKLQYPVRVGKKDLRIAKFLLTQYGGPDGELSAAIRYLTQRYTMPTKVTQAILNDIGTEEMAHLEMIATMFYRLTENATPQQLETAGLGAYYAVHGQAVFPAAPSGEPWTAAYIQATSDPVADLHEDMAAEQKARAAYERLLRLSDDPDLMEGLKFLREREIVHFQRFGEALDLVQEHLDHRHVF